TADENEVARHFANTLFNTMRGGIYDDNYSIFTVGLKKHIQHFNSGVWFKYQDFLSSLPESIEYSKLDTLIQEQNDDNLYRLFLEYLPLTFSRRHGDPSRPWNLFNINIKDENGNKLLSYQGNWRDIFQNWEALSLSYPGYINGIIGKFLNATTADGYNPYKVASEGIDWEVIEPENPWSNIGYWGDHQIIYLLKLLELSRRHYPGDLPSWLNRELFAFANVPYRLKSYEDIVDNPKNTIRFDDELHYAIEKLEKTYGSDARLVHDNDGNVKLVTFTEKILATLLAKLSNFIPEAGIWMNTLRPEWNDANNALVGTGASMVTLYYMRRFVAFAKELYAGAADTDFTVSSEMQAFFSNIDNTFRHFAGELPNGFSDQLRRQVADRLGKAGNDYRDKVYAGFSGAPSAVSKPELTAFFELVLQFIDQSIAVNKRPDNLYHAYNLVSFTDDAVTIRYLYEMLEGQVAVLSSGKLSAAEALEVINALRGSALYRPDQQSYILYPNKRLPSFLEKNRIPAEEINRIPALKEMVGRGDSRIVSTDRKGEFHFNASFNNASFLTAALLKAEVPDTDRKEIEQLYEKLFDHQSFTGRSGTFYKYEGLGCIYWHMVSKLLLAIGENIQKAIREEAGTDLVVKLKHHYQGVKAGIGSHKSPADYGSFPFDPYSHTPLMAGVQQPGMTGQVKEDIISRFFELGIVVENGCLSIRPDMLGPDEFIQPAGSVEAPFLMFSYCSVPFVYVADSTKGIEIMFAGGKQETTNGYSLTPEQSQLVFNRSKQVEMVRVHFNNINEKEQ
ncbi:MAG TPA: hypothetical protein VK152_10530, partial [Paludibacter sp.]|nr:hypothetical protein [Paludibacter sp.]